MISSHPLMASAVPKMGRDHLASNETQTKPSPEAWSLHRQIIIDLYVARGLKLKDVQDFMTEQHSFMARYGTYLALIHTASPCIADIMTRNWQASSRREYQTRLKKWGISKNLTRDKREEILRRDELGENAFDRGKESRNCWNSANRKRFWP